MSPIGVPVSRSVSKRVPLGMSAFWYSCPRHQDGPWCRMPGSRVGVGRPCRTSAEAAVASQAAPAYFSRSAKGNWPGGDARGGGFPAGGEGGGGVGAPLQDPHEDLGDDPAADRPEPLTVVRRQLRLLEDV